MAVLTAVQVEQLAEAAGPHGALMRFAAYSGCRFGEAAALRAGRVDLLRAKVTIAESASEVGGEVIFQTPKTDRTRTVNLPRFVAEELAPLVADKGPDDLVFTRQEAARSAIRGSSGSSSVPPLMLQGSRRGFASTTYATRAQRCSSPRAFIRARSPIGSGTPPCGEEGFGPRSGVPVR